MKHSTALRTIISAPINGLAKLLAFAIQGIAFVVKHFPPVFFYLIRLTACVMASSIVVVAILPAGSSLGAPILVALYAASLIVSLYPLGNIILGAGGSNHDFGKSFNEKMTGEITNTRTLECAEAGYGRGLVGF